MALLFQEFLHAFDTIVFAIINDHNNNGTYEAFGKVIRERSQIS